MQCHILTLFPEVFSPYLQTSILGRAVAHNQLQVQLHNIRDYTSDKHRTVDDTPYGGGAGMVMKIEPIDQALAALNARLTREQQQVIVLSARGQQFTQARAHALARAGKHITLICGRYEGIDQRVIDHLADEEVSIGPYVLAGGELAALVVIEAVARLLPGVLGNPASLAEESFTSAHDTATVEYPQYTKPEEYHGWKVPPVLLSGNHAAIKAWRAEQQRTVPKQM